ncbi:TPA: hypothetical protein H1016_04365 [archaeon]|uniref:Uncharacterized protein n=1 Tax=Candidatus Naiadarchaeum limnaeum TaxID=2756139 RepID=A0A832V2A1_9ARCH|nr:hypothetical protein [Candidatus Naiadarchaeum limnaeum]
MTGFAQILFLIGITIGGGYLGMWLRRFEMSGFELWFPIGLLVSYAINPLIGFIVAFSILVITWALFPYGLHHLAITAASFGIMFYIAKLYFPVTAETFFMQAMYVAIIFQIASNIFYVLTKYPWIRIFKFIILNLALSYLIFSRFGWQLVQWLK